MYSCVTKILEASFSTHTNIESKFVGIDLLRIHCLLDKKYNSKYKTEKKTYQQVHFGYLIYSYIVC